MNIVLFLGAGFSAPFGLPVMRDVLDFAWSSSRIDDADKTFLEKLRVSARDASSFLHSDVRNLEDMLSFFMMRERLGLSDGTEAGRLRRILQRLFTYVPYLPQFWSRYDILDGFLGFEMRKTAGRLAIVTTNYDLNAECALHRSNLSASLGFQYVVPDRSAFKDALYSPRGVPLFKLHGSVNWYYPSDPASTQIVVDGSLAKLLWDEKEIVAPTVCAADHSVESLPFIVPPAYLKPEFNDVLRQVWKGAADVLRKADVLVVVGYSFPQSDIDMAFFLSIALKENPRLSRIVIVDRSANAVVDRLRASERYGPHFKQLLDPRQGDWQELKAVTH